jgi:WD40 repeat protein
VAFAPDGRSLASGSTDGRVGLWSLDGSPPPQARPDLAIDGPVLALAYSPDGRLLAAGSEGLVRLWDLSVGGQAAAVGLHDLRGRVNALAFSPDGRRLAGGDQAVQVWRLDGGRPEPESVRPGSEAWLRALDFSPDGAAVVCLDTFGHGTVWAAEGSAVSSWQVFGPLILKGAFAPDGRHVLSVNGDGSLWVLRLRGRWWDV